MSGMRSAGDHLWVISSTTDAVGRCTHIDEQWLAFTGQSRSEALGSGWFDALHPEDRPKTVETLRATWEDRAALRTEFRVRRVDGAFRWAQMVGAPRYDAGAFIGYVGSIVDIDDRRAIEQTLRASEQKLRVAHERLTAALRVAPIILFEQQGRDLRYVWILNPSLDIRADDLVGKTDYDLFERVEDAQAVLAIKRGVFETGRAARREVQVMTGGVPRWYDLSVEPRSTGGSIDGILCAATDITERKRAEEAQEAADRRKDEFLAILGHELRNPLMAIQNGVEILRRTRATDTSTAGPATIAMMGRQVGHLVRLVDDLLEISRINSDKIELRTEPVDVASILGDALDAARPHIEKQGHRVETRLAGGALRTFGDPTRLAQVLTNVLNNAARYTQPGGLIEITAERVEDEAAIRVRDNGVGIAPDMLPGIFDLFSQVDSRENGAEPGLGVGLALAKKLAELHGGAIEARSSGIGKGSEFVVRLPLYQSPGPPAAAEQPQPARRRRTRVLVVDDDHDVADSLALLIESLQAEVRVAYDGASGLEVALEFEPRVALIDIRMVGIDGYETARRFRAKLGAATPTLVALTGLGQDEDRKRAFGAGFDRHLTKPVSVDELERLLQIE